MSIQASVESAIRMHLNEIEPPISYSHHTILSKYRRDSEKSLSEQIAKDLAIKEGNLIFDSGADGCLKTLFSFLHGQDIHILLPKDSYPGFLEIIQMIGARYDFYGPDQLDSILLEENSQVCLVLCHPNNPSGEIFELDPQRLSLFQGYIVVDESYIEFQPQATLVPFAANSERLLCVRSFSKVFCAPSLRLGYIVGSEAIVHKLSLAQTRYPLSDLVFEIGLEIWRQKTVYVENAQKLNSLVEECSTFLRESGYQVLKSATHFFLFRAESSEITRELREHFRRNSCLVKRIVKADSSEWIRVSLKSQDAGSKFRKLVKEFNKEKIYT